MRNLSLPGTLILMLGLVGCVDQQKALMEGGYRALDQKNYNEAIAKADEFLRLSPHGPAAAEALYIKGQAIELRSSPPAPPVTQQQAFAILRDARLIYVRALSENPMPVPEAYIRSALANVAYRQEDYNTALAEWVRAYEKIDDKDTKAWALYRMGLCQQRLNRFDQADRTFKMVVDQYPNSVQSQRSKEHMGQRQFYVQVATLTKADAAEKAMGDMRKLGLTPLRLADPQGRQVIRIGPFSAYESARSVKQRVMVQYPDAMVVP